MINRFSIIIPTRNRAGSLKRLLTSFDSIEWPDSADSELLIVDNGSNDQTRSVLSAEHAKFRKCSLRVLEEAQKGKSSALNRGLAAAKGDIILILDDDVVTHRELLVKHLECYGVSHFDAIQGRVLPGLDLDDRPADSRRLREYNTPIINYGEEICEIRGLTGTNMSFNRAVFEKVGFFDPRLGPGASGFSEDTEFSMRIRKAGFKIGYTPRAVVYHELNPARYGRAYNRDVEYRKGVSRSIYRHDSILFRVFPDLVTNCLRYGIYRILRLSQKAYKTEGRIMKCWGYLSGKLQQVTQEDSAL